MNFENIKISRAILRNGLMLTACFNPHKCKCMLVPSKRRNASPHSLLQGNEVLEQVKIVQGVVLSSDLL